MTPAEKKRQENISEYIIHMSQTEDLIRAFDFDLNQITDYVVRHIPVDEQEKKDIILWYADIIEKMQAEGLEKTGHLANTQRYVAALDNLKTDLLVSDKAFEKIWDETHPSVRAHKQVSGEDDIQICLNGIYGLLLLQTCFKTIILT